MARKAIQLATSAAAGSGGSTVGKLVSTMHAIQINSKRIAEISEGIGNVSSAVMEVDKMTPQNPALALEAAATGLIVGDHSADGHAEASIVSR